MQKKPAPLCNVFLFLLTNFINFVYCYNQKWSAYIPGINHLTLIAFRHYLTEVVQWYLHFFYILTIKYRIPEQSNHTEQVVYGHCDWVHMMCFKWVPFTWIHVGSLFHHWSIAMSKMSSPRLHQTWISRCFSSLAFWMSVPEWSSTSDS